MDALHGIMDAASYKVTRDAKGNLVLPDIPAQDNVSGLCAWLTAVFNLDLRHGITGGAREGLRGPEGHVVLTRAGASSIRFEPVARISTPGKLIETLSWSLDPSDGAVHAFTGAHCRQIEHVVKMLCGAFDSLTAHQEAEGVISTLMMEAVAVEGHTTYGNSGQRYESVIALRRELDSVTGRPTGPRRYLIDANTGEYVVAAHDAQEAARRHVGSSLPRGWLDARMDALGWSRVELQGYGSAGRRRGPHARILAYRGHLSREDPEWSEPANTQKHAPTRETKGATRARDKEFSRVHVFTGSGDALVDEIKNEFDATELTDGEWDRYSLARHVETRELGS